MIDTNFQNNISFKAKIGTNIYKLVSNELCYDSKRITKFEKLFSDTFEKTLDTNTIVDIDKNKNWVLSHLAFPDIKFCYKVLEKNGKSLSQNLIMECPKVFATSERNLFRTIISKSSKKGADFKEISQIANKILTCNSRKKFLNEIEIAKRIKSEHPASQLKIEDFEYMSNIIDNEALQNPNSDLSKLIASFFKRN